MRQICLRLIFATFASALGKSVCPFAFLTPTSHVTFIRRLISTGILSPGISLHFDGSGSLAPIIESNGHQIRVPEFIVEHSLQLAVVDDLEGGAVAIDEYRWRLTREACRL